MMIRRLTSILISLLLLTAQLTIHAATVESATEADSTRCEAHAFRPKQLIVPGALIALGAVGTIYRQPSKFVETQTGWTHTTVGSYLQFAPLAGYLALDYCGVKARHGLTDRLLMGATGAALTVVADQACKWIIDERRPDGSDRRSFPSNHTALAFMGAELVRMDYGPAAGTVAYIAAGAVGVLRLTCHRHWLNDVVAGAGVGILAARAASWLLPLERKILGMKNGDVAAVIVPGYAPLTRSATLTAAIVF